MFMTCDWEPEKMRYADLPFDADMAPSLCMLTSVSPAESLCDITCPVMLCDTEQTENAALLCQCARERGLSLTVLLTRDGDFPCDRLIVPVDRYEKYRDAAPTVGVRFSYDVTTPEILSRVLAYADRGIGLIDAYPEHPGDRREGEQTALLDELKRTAMMLAQREKDGYPIEFLPFSVMGLHAKHGIGAHRNERCHTCTHRMICGGRRLSYADCEVKQTLADCAVFLENARTHGSYNAQPCQNPPCAASDIEIT